MTTRPKALIPLYDASADLACTITDGEIPERVATIERLRTALRRLERTPHGMVLHLPPADDVEDDVRRFAVDEKRCCRFWGFEVTRTPDEVVLRWDAPPTADELVDALVRYFTSDEPLGDLRGLL